MKILVSTFGSGDGYKVLDAMRAIPYDRLVLVGDADARASEDFTHLSQLESMAGQGIEYQEVDGMDFMDLVELVSEVLNSSRTEDGCRNTVVLNISGGPKLLGDAALFAAFRWGVEAYHCDGPVTRLPVLMGATAKDRFTKAQMQFLLCVRGGCGTLEDVMHQLGVSGRQSVERVLRELKKAGLVSASVVGGRITVSLTDEGVEVCRAIGS
jgi:hypothetical protein